MNTTCEYCSKILSSKRAFDRHQNTCNLRTIKLLQDQYEAQLQTQREQYEQEIQITRRELQTQREHYESQIQILKEHYESQIQILKEQLEKFETQIFEIAKQPKLINHNNHNTKTTNNNQKTLNMINQLAPMDFNQDQKQLQELFQQEFTEEVFFEGPNRITRVVIDNILVEPETGKLRMACTDTSRKHFKYTEGESGEIKTDHGMNRLHELIKKPLVNANMMAYLQTIKDAGENTVEICRNIRERNEEFITSRHMFSDKIISETSK